MDAVRDTFGYEYKATPSGFQVLPRSIETRIFNVNYLNMDRGGASQTSFGAGEITKTSSNLLRALHPATVYLKKPCQAEMFPPPHATIFGKS